MADKRKSLIESFAEASREPALKVKMADGACWTLKLEEEIGRGGSCIAYLAIVQEGARPKSKQVVKEFYPAEANVAGVTREGLSLYVPENQKATFEKFKSRFAEGVTRLNLYCEKDGSIHSDTAELGEGEANGVLYSISSMAGAHFLKDDPPTEVNTIAQVMQSLCYALAVLHNNVNDSGEPDPIVYLDTKPANLFWTSVDGGSWHLAKLFDFDTRTNLWELKSGEEAFVSGSEGWIAPEHSYLLDEDPDIQSIGRSLISEAADVYGVGALFFWLMFGRQPKAEDDTASDVSLLERGKFDLVKRCKDFPRGFDSDEVRRLVARILVKSLKEDVAERCHSIEEIANDFGKLYDRTHHSPASVDVTQEESEKTRAAIGAAEDEMIALLGSTEQRVCERIDRALSSFNIALEEKLRQYHAEMQESILRANNGWPAHSTAEEELLGSATKIQDTRLNEEPKKGSLVDTPWGPNRPMFTWEKRAPYATINSIVDNPGIGDERNFVQIRDINDSHYRDEISLDSGHVYEVYIYYHNGADPESIGKKAIGIADGLAVKSSFPAKAEAGKRHSVTATIFASDTDPGDVWDGAYIRSNQDLYLRYVPGTATIHNGGGLNGKPIGPDYLFGEGALLGYNKYSGLLPGGSEYAGYVTYCLYASKYPNAIIGMADPLDSSSWELNGNSETEGRCNHGPDRPALAMDMRTPTPVFNSIVDNPIVGDERNFVRIGKITPTATVMKPTIEIEPGWQYLVYVYVNNNASPTRNDSSADHEAVSYKTLISCLFSETVSPNSPGVIKATISSENASPQSVWCSASITSKAEQVSLHYVLGSSRIFNDWKANGSIVPSALFSDGGTAIGLNELNGVVPAGEKYQSVIAFVLQAEAPKISRGEHSSEGKALPASKTLTKQGNPENAKLHMESNGDKPKTRASASGNEAPRAMHLGHSGFFVELPTASMLFDWYKGELPPVRQDKPLYVFVSHIHSDHFRWESFNLAAQHPSSQIFLGYDYSHPELNGSLSKLPESLKDRLSCFKGEQKLYSDDGRALVSSLESTDLGVAFVVEVDGRRFYHAGDLALWTRPEGEYIQQFVQAIVDNPEACIPNYEGYRKSNLDNFRRCIEPLRGQVFDFGMLPLDPNLDEMGIETVEEYMAIAEFRTWSPMHLWERYEYVDRYVIEHPENAKKMIGFTSASGCKKSVKPGEWFELI